MLFSNWEPTILHPPLTQSNLISYTIEFPVFMLLSKLGNFNSFLATFKNIANLVISTDSSFKSTP